MALQKTAKEATPIYDESSNFSVINTAVILVLVISAILLILFIING